MSINSATNATEQYLNRVRLVAIVERTHPSSDALQLPSTGYLVDAGDMADLEDTLDSIRRGATAKQPGLRKVQVTIHKGDPCASPCLSRREKQVLCALAKGMSYKMIADRLGISFETVRSHVKGIYKKMNVNNNTTAVAKAMAHGLVAA